ncbi:hypothetical protein vBVpPvVp04M_00057 [Vibrio phage vB_Vp_PvVp04_M]|nr:hypothetical protein vBVpPvVp04M_00057 [Vibrio phage vB_Vp_PvVp04_M]
MFSLKMSEVFNGFSGLVVHVNKNKVKENSDDGVTPFDAIDYAVANHDDLVSENLSLKAEVRKLKGESESLNLTRPNRPDLSSIPLEVARYIESLEYGIEKVDGMCLKHATRCDELHEALDGLVDTVSRKGISTDNFIGADCRKSLQRAIDALGDPDEI